MPTDKLVLRAQRGGAAINMRARMLTTGVLRSGEYAEDADFTAIGLDIRKALQAVDGLELVEVSRHSVLVRPWDAHLWTADEIERAAIQAISQATGTEYEIVRPDA